MVHRNVEAVACLYNFTALRELCLVHQDFVAIPQGLSDCPQLEVLWVAECGITKIEGLDALLNLKRLYLYSNQIETMDNLSHLTQLKTLWLCSNRITSVAGLATLTSLEELWLASNFIETISTSLDTLKNLKELNLADNLISSFEDITHLTKLPQLSTLWLCDPLYGTNPVCDLCNYKTYALNILKNLHQLDSSDITDEVRGTAEAAFVKKKMYYNMKEKTLKRNMTGALKAAGVFRTQFITQLHNMLVEVSYVERGIKRELNELKYYGRTPVRISEVPIKSEQPTQEYEKQLNLKLAASNRAQTVLDTKFTQVQSTFARLKVKLEDLSDTYLGYLHVEQCSGGNTHLEVGTAQDPWVEHCLDLFYSRAESLASSYSSARGASVPRVHRVLKLHNRHLRHLFEQKVANTTRRHFEYLFYIFDASHTVLWPHFTWDHIVQKGFLPPTVLKAAGYHGSVMLSNSVPLCMAAAKEEQPQITDGDDKPLGDPAFTHKLLVVRCFLGNVKNYSKPVTLKPSTKNYDAKESEQTEPTVICRESFPEFDSVCCPLPEGGSARVWHVFHRNMVLPEYVIEFSVPPQSPQHPLGRTPATDFEQPEHILLQEKFAAELQDLHTSDEVDIAIANLKCMPPNLPRRIEFFRITEDFILRHLALTDLTTVTYLDLYGCGISQIENLTQLVNLRELVCAFNRIRRIEGVAELKCLELLDISFNDIRRIEGLKTLTQLKVLLLASNSLDHLGDVKCLQKTQLQLHTLNLSHNPICETPCYRQGVLRALPHLKFLDGVPTDVKPEGGPTCIYAPAMSQRLLTERGSTCLRQTAFSYHTRASPLFSRSCSIISGLSTAALAMTRCVEEDRVMELDLHGMGLHHMMPLQRLVNLQVLNVSANHMSVIEGLTAVTRLLELNMEDNRIVDLRPLACLKLLRRLDAGKNSVASADGLEGITALEQLSLEDNEISSLAPLLSLTNLMELYFANNPLHSVRELSYLRDAARLCVLDLSGTPLANGAGICLPVTATAAPAASSPAASLAAEARRHIIYRMPRLRALDGEVVTQEEAVQARERFTGRLTATLLEELIGMTALRSLQQLNLIGHRLKFFDPLPAEIVSRLEELNLNNNCLSSLCDCPLIVPTLLVLTATHNKISQLAPAPSPGNSPRGVPSTAAPPESLSLRGDELTVNMLQELDLTDNSVSSLHTLHLRAFPYLRRLVLTSNQITKLEDGLLGLTQLEELILDKNNLRTFEDSAFRDQHLSLTVLSAQDNAIRAVGGIQFLMQLRTLRLCGNRLTEFHDVEKLQPVTTLEELMLTGNPISRRPAYQSHLMLLLPSVQVCCSLHCVAETLVRH
eukprot:TRINITY_DN4229_c0_g1_i6.p1 TRINITY_DN4229_c0_g1~~TRINITY_DN4229_c0_g1_i6.p1  ORF type:complete len:1372 (+),score=295.00 TRINITY_DN4229_c0_g1_i6:107-4117(+)